MNRRERLEKLHETAAFWEASVAGVVKAYDWAVDQQTGGPWNDETWDHWMNIRLALKDKLEHVRKERARVQDRIAEVEQEEENQ